MADHRFPATDPDIKAAPTGAGFSMVLVFVAFFVIGLGAAFFADYDHSVPKPESNEAVADIGVEPYGR